MSESTLYMPKIDGFSNFTLDGIRYEWNETFKQYWTVTGEPKALMRADIALLKLNDSVIFVGDPTSVGFAFKNISDTHFSGRTIEQHTAYLRELKEKLGMREELKGTLTWIFGDSSKSATI